MQAQTQILLQTLHSLHWFNHVGQSSFDHHLVSSWAVALQLRESHEWRVAQNEIRNELGSIVQSYSYETYNLWNEVVRELRPFAEALARQALTVCNLKSDLERKLLVAVQADCLLVAHAMEYREFGVCESADQMAEIYLSGHFVSGWLGDYPQGVFIVY